MRRLILLSIFAVSVNISTAQEPLTSLDDCVVVNLKEHYWNAVYHLMVLSYKAVGIHSNANFVFSPRTIWIMLAAIAEGSDDITQQQLFKLLNLPDDICLRQKYYQIATSRILPVEGVDLRQTMALLVDEGITLNPSWLDIVSRNSLLDVVTAPIKNDPTTTAIEIKRVMAANVPRLDLSGNSVLLDAIDYNGLWATAFSDAVIERAPFYSQTGEQIGAVDLMRVKRRARMGYLRSLNGKVLELPVGTSSHYRMLLIIVMERDSIENIVSKIRNDIVLEMFSSLRESNVPIDVAIPRFEITSEVDVRTVLEDLGVTRVWTEPEATRNISSPPAFPSSYLQRATLTLDRYGVREAPFEEDPPVGTPTGLEPEVGSDFIANQPFLFGLFDVETYTPLIAVGYATPTYID